MSDSRTSLPLCIYSEAVGGHYETRNCHHQTRCPLGLEKVHAKQCACRTRQPVGRVGGDGYSQPASNQIVQVNACTFPNTWDGNRILRPESLAAAIRRRHQGEEKSANVPTTFHQKDVRARLDAFLDRILSLKEDWPDDQMDFIWKKTDELYALFGMELNDTFFEKYGNN